MKRNAILFLALLSILIWVGYSFWLRGVKLNEVRSVGDAYISNIQYKNLRAAYDSLHPNIKKFHTFEKFEQSWNAFYELFGEIKSYKHMSYVISNNSRVERVNTVYSLQMTKVPMMLDLTIDKRGDTWMIDIFHGFQSPKKMEVTNKPHN